jgi:glycine/D-amino acid oxidase-like deaminating enzyme
MKTYDTAVVGGGLVGAALAYGLARRGLATAVVDEGDVAYRASRGNFGLVWVQGKGLDFTPYADWTRTSAERWAGFAHELLDLTGVDVAHRQPGGLEICLTAEDYAERAGELARLAEQTEGRFEYEMLDARALGELVPGASETLAGAAFCPHDGHANPLYLLRALHQGLALSGGTYLPEGPVTEIRPEGGGFALVTRSGRILAGRVVLAAGLGSTALAAALGLAAPLRPNRGQILVTERVAPFLGLPTLDLRQTAEGSLQLGGTHEDVGLDEGTTSGAMTAIARRAVTAFPFLRSVRVVRSWGALRIMTPDGAPIYDVSEGHPGAYLAACHSGVTLAAVHAERLAAWIAGADPLPEVRPFSAKRFHVQAAA